MVPTVFPTFSKEITQELVNWLKSQRNERLKFAMDLAVDWVNAKKTNRVKMFEHTLDGIAMRFVVRKDNVSLYSPRGEIIATKNIGTMDDISVFMKEVEDLARRKPPADTTKEAIRMTVADYLAKRGSRIRINPRGKI